MRTLINRHKCKHLVILNDRHYYDTLESVRFDKRDIWCHENLDDEHLWTSETGKSIFANNNDSNFIRFWFEHQGDALAFKLVWG